MYLKSIEIQGFKSFANKTKLEFHEGFTGIVGPNGSGKSNVGDAVRWVLGEQRVKQLRGGSMQDVIFAGTELRKPQSFAYVAITLDNSDHALPLDYTEVTVARRLFRSGESEYLINGSAVRLKDVQETFYDTGIGKEGYSIIGQGQIERILSDKPEDRRELFDEAAGIVKFKRRKEQSIKKLENEKSNLERVTDILSELEKQVGPLEKQAEKARIFLDKREQQKKLDVNVFLLENEKTSREIDTLKASLESAEASLEAAETGYNEAREGYASASEEQSSTEDALEEARNTVSRAGIAKSRLQNDINLFEEQIRSARSNAEHFETRRKSVSEEIERRSAEKAEKEQKNREMEESVRALVSKKEAFDATCRQTIAEEEEIQAGIEEKRQGLLDLINQRGSIRSRQAMLKTKEEQLAQQQSELARSLVEISSDEQAHEQKIRDLGEQISLVIDNIGRLKAQYASTEREIFDKKELLTKEDEHLRASETQYHQEKSRLDALINLTERYEGFGGSVKRIMEERKREPGIIGVVADLIKTESRYEAAIEVALGGSIQNVVTKDTGTAKRLISILKREKAGRATFLPLDSIDSSQGFNMMGVLKEPGIIGLADTLVRTAPEHTPVARNLLGRIVVADTFEHAAAAEAKFGHRIRMVTLDGELFSPGGAISGGTYRNQSNLLGRRREIADLEKRAKELGEAMQASEEKIAEIKGERNRLRARLDTLRIQVQSAEMEQNTLKIRIAEEEEKKKSAGEGYQSLQGRSDAIEKAGQALVEEKAQIEKELQESEQTERENGRLIAGLQDRLSEIKEREDEEAKESARLGLEVEKLRQQAGFARQELDRITEESARFEKELAEIEESIASGSFSIEDKEKKIEETRARIEEADAAESAAKDRLKSLGEAREALAAKIRELVAKRDSLLEEKTGLDKEVYRLSAQKEKLEETLETQSAYMWTEYELTLSQAYELQDEELTDLEAMKKQIRSLKNEIKALGAVNVNAIEEYRDVSERYTFLKGQHDDLVEAAAALEKIIEELDTNMRRQFKEQFARIQSEFDKVFKELFGGGSGKLELMEDEDILVAGVRVIAQPPGKKLQNMMQMSGGEKSLTAISLLFAIQNLKPSPFCLLDEIEAALDESNVSRFAGYIHKLTKNTQFIVVTHRRGTMERADRLYGITMQEKGISTLVSVDLIDDKDLVS